MSNKSQVRVALALVVDDKLCNRAWKSTMQWQKYGFGFRVLRLPPHVSLKQPFVVPSLQRFEVFFDKYAKQLEAQTILLEGFNLYESGGEGVVVVRVREDARLRTIHCELNQALTEEFGPTPAAFDGEDYRFHLTVAIGQYRVEQKDQLLTDIESIPFRECTVARRLGMFIYEESKQANALYGTREYGTYKILPLKA